MFQINFITLSWFITLFLLGMLIGVILGMIRMWFYMNKKMNEYGIITSKKDTKILLEELRKCSK